MLAELNALQQAKRCISLYTSIGKWHVRVVKAVGSDFNIDLQQSCCAGIFMAHHCPLSSWASCALAQNVTAQPSLVFWQTK
jgi:hypothetical protein